MIKQPMDLTTIEDKLRHNKYPDPWQYCSDMRLMLDNAWAYNKKGSRVHRDATTVSSCDYCADKHVQVIWLELYLSSNHD